MYAVMVVLCRLIIYTYTYFLYRKYLHKATFFTIYCLHPNTKLATVSQAIARDTRSFKSHAQYKAYTTNTQNMRPYTHIGR